MRFCFITPWLLVSLVVPRGSPMTLWTEQISVHMRTHVYTYTIKYIYLYIRVDILFNFDCALTYETDLELNPEKLS